MGRMPRKSQASEISVNHNHVGCLVSWNIDVDRNGGSTLKQDFLRGHTHRQMRRSPSPIDNELYVGIYLCLFIAPSDVLPPATLWLSGGLLVMILWMNHNTQIIIDGDDEDGDFPVELNALQRNLRGPIAAGNAAAVAALVSAQSTSETWMRVPPGEPSPASHAPAGH